MVIRDPEFFKLLFLHFLPRLFWFFWLPHAACGILVPQSGTGPGPSAVRAGSPNHWTTRECPCLPFLKSPHSLNCLCWPDVQSHFTDKHQEERQGSLRSPSSLPFQENSWKSYTLPLSSDWPEPARIGHTAPLSYIEDRNVVLDMSTSSPNYWMGFS